jgi:hypothetical protein
MPAQESSQPRIMRPSATSTGRRAPTRTAVRRELDAVLATMKMVAEDKGGRARVLRLSFARTRPGRKCLIRLS